MPILRMVTGFLCLNALLCAATQDYDKVITKDAKTTKGVFIVHRIADGVYYEIPKVELGKEFLWDARVTETPADVGFGGFLVANKVVRWDLSGQRVLLRDVNYEATADPRTPMAAAVKASNGETIVMAFDVLAYSSAGAPVIDVTRLFTSDVAEFGIRARIGANSLDGSRTWIDKISPYPDNIEAEVTETWVRNEANPAPGQMHQGDATLVLHHSMIRLPKTPMMARLYDDRVGLFQTTSYDYGADSQRVPVRRLIDRWRLEKKNPNAEVSEPVKPIVYYIDPATPAKWHDSICKAVNEWLPAFEEAGFRNAIVCREAPSPSEDPEFNADDVRYSVIRWLPSTTQNAFGPNVHDPRTGEILNASIEFHHNMLELARNWYFIQVGALDPGASQLPLSDESMGRAIQYVVAHEVGHTLGLEHNLKASSLYPQAKVRDKDWVHVMGFTPSIMDYVRFNYVAQPEDNIPPEDLAPTVGPYDRWAIHWAYTPITGAKTPEAEKPTLDKWARQQDDTPWLRYTTIVGWSGSADIGELTEAVGDDDAITSTGLGLKNLQRVEKMLVSATAATEGEPLDDLAEMYGVLISQWSTELGHVVAIVGGSTSQAKNAGQSGYVFTPVSRERQRLAVNFLNQYAFATPTWMVDPEVLRRIESTGALSRMRSAQVGILNNLLESGRFGRLVEQNALDPKNAWSPAELLFAVRTGIWSELSRPQVRIDAYRRNLQRAFIDIAVNRVNGANTDERPLYRAELKSLDAAIEKAIPVVADKMTHAYLDEIREQISRALDPRGVMTRGAAPISNPQPGPSAIGYDVRVMR